MNQQHIIFIQLVRWIFLMHLELIWHLNLNVGLMKFLKIFFLNISLLHQHRIWVDQVQVEVFILVETRTIILFLASCQLLRSNIRTESDNSTMFQLPLFNLSQQQQPELSSRRYDTMSSRSQSLSNQSRTRGILKISAPSISDLLSTVEGKNEFF